MIAMSEKSPSEDAKGMSAKDETITIECRRKSLLGRKDGHIKMIIRARHLTKKLIPSTIPKKRAEVPKNPYYNPSSSLKGFLIIAYAPISP